MARYPRRRNEYTISSKVQCIVKISYLDTDDEQTEEKILPRKETSPRAIMTSKIERATKNVCNRKIVYEK